MKNILLLIILSSFVISCNTKSRGKIIRDGECKGEGCELTGNRQQYLVNTSTSQVITFTLKYIQNEHFSSDEISENVTEYFRETKTYTLKPGEEIKIECEKYCPNKEKDRWYSNEYEIVGAMVGK